MQISKLGKILMLSAALLLLMLLMACEEDSDGAGDLVASGSAIDGRIVDGSGEVYALSSDGVETLIGSMTTDLRGNYSVGLPRDLRGPIRFRMTSGTYIDGATGDRVTLSAEDPLEAIANATGHSIVVQLNLFTTMASLLLTPPIDDRMVDATNAAIVVAFGLPALLPELLPLDLLDETDAEMYAALSDSQEAAFGLQLGALAELAEAAGVSPGELAALFVEDAGDGILNGLDAEGNPVLGLGANSASTDMGEAIEDFVDETHVQSVFTSIGLPPPSSTDPEVQALVENQNANPGIVPLGLLEVGQDGRVLAFGDTLDVGRSVIGEAVAVDIIIGNSGIRDLTLESPSLTSTEFVLNGALVEGGMLSPGETSTLTVTFTPTELGPRTATLSFSHTGSIAPTPFELTLSGLGNTDCEEVECEGVCCAAGEECIDGVCTPTGSDGDADGDSDADGDGDADGDSDADGDGDGDETCLDGVVGPGEQCEPGLALGESCEGLGFDGGELVCAEDCTFDTSGCTLVPRCGNGVLDGDDACDGDDFGVASCVSEGFDLGELRCTGGCELDTSYCSMLPYCGETEPDEGLVSGLEQCDGEAWHITCYQLGFASGDLGCDEHCGFDTSGCVLPEPICGDGVVNWPLDACEGDASTDRCSDYGLGSGNVGCHAESCRLDFTTCEHAPTNTCGNGIVEPPIEQCDGYAPSFDSTLGSCAGNGGGGGRVICGDDCRFDYRTCSEVGGYEPVCGDGWVTHGEACDGSDLQGETCESAGFDSGELRCSRSCHFDVSGCRRCGDGVLSGEEACDGDDLGGTTCEDLGYASGELICDDDCSFNSMNCLDSVCGNGVRDELEPCEGADLGGATCEGLGFEGPGGVLACDDDCQLDATGCVSVDVDGDGYGSEVDCDDDDETIHPGAEELVGDGVDQDCDGLDGCRDLDCDGEFDVVLSVSQTEWMGTYEVDSYVYHGPELLEADRTALPTMGASGHAIADLDGDGYLDVVFANLRYEYTVGAPDSYIYWGGADGLSPTDVTTVPTSLEPATGARRVLVVDLNDDSCVDLVFSPECVDAPCDPNTLIYWGSAGGYFEGDRAIIGELGSYDVAAGDLDADGFTDLVLTNGPGHPTRIHWGSVTGPSNDDWEPRGSGAWGVAIADLDGDGHLDLATTLHRTQLWWGSPSGPADSPIEIEPGLVTDGLAVGQVDGDGRLDLIMAVTGGDFGLYDAPIFLGRREGYDTHARIDVDVHVLDSVFAGDLDGDGRVEILYAGQPAGTPSPSARAFSVSADRIPSVLFDIDQNGGHQATAVGPFINVPRSVSCPIRWELACDDGDDDADGVADCDDADCAGDALCPGPTPTESSCSDLVDNDGDRYVDCDDPDCADDVDCVSPEICDNLIDDDRDGFVDCFDPDCIGIPPCPAP